MFKIFALSTKVLNGTVTLTTSICGFTTKKLAENARDAVNEANKDACYRIINDIIEIEVFENEEEVPILNQKIQEE